MEDAVARFCSASMSKDIEGMMATLAADVELVSPVSAHLVFRGNGDVRALLTAVYGSLADLRWGPQIGQGAERVVVGSARIAGLRLGDAMVFELDGDGLITRIRPHLRPWLALTVFALVVAPKLAGELRVVLRAFRPR